MKSMVNTSLEGNGIAGPGYCALGLKFAQLGRVAAVGWSAQDRAAHVNFAVRPGSNVNTRNGAVLEQWPGTHGI